MVFFRPSGVTQVYLGLPCFLRHLRVEGFSIAALMPFSLPLVLFEFDGLAERGSLCVEGTREGGLVRNSAISAEYTRGARLPMNR